jgi:hypothetical protein
MGMQTDVRSVHAEATGTVVTFRTRVKAYHCISGGTAGDVIFRDGGSGGTILLQFNIGAGTQPINMLIPGEGIVFGTNVHVTLPAASKITVFYG